MSGAKYSREEVAARGEEIYLRELKSDVENQHKGEYLVIDIETGDYEIDPDDALATKRLLTRHPDAVVYGVRIGYPAAYRLGGFSKVSKR